MQTQKLQKVIGSGLLSLPSFWREINKIQKGDDIRVIMTDDAIIAVKNNEQAKEKLQKLNIEMEDD